MRFSAPVLSARQQLGVALLSYVIFMAVFLALHPGAAAGAGERFGAAFGGFLTGMVLSVACWFYSDRFAASRAAIAELRLTRRLTRRAKIISTVPLAFLGLLTVMLGGRGIVSVFREPPEQILNIFLAAVTAGTFEEFLIRGLMLGALLSLLRHARHRFFWAAVISAVTFGVIHLPNMIVASSPAVAQQVFYASVLGLALALLYLRTGRLWLPVLCHFLVDFQPAVAAAEALPASPKVTLLLVYGPFAAVCLYALWQLDSSDAEAASDDTGEARSAAAS